MMSESSPLLQVRDLCKRFPVRKGLFGRVAGHVHAVEHVDLDVEAGRTLGLVGESGCGKSTTGRCILHLTPPSAGSVEFDGVDLATLSPEALRRQRRHMQMIFQDPYGSLNPSHTVRQLITEGMKIHRLVSGSEVEDRAVSLMQRVGLEAGQLDFYPHQFSGGQRQRIGIARALALEPRFIVCDEAVSALDVSVQAQVLNLLQDLQDEFGIAYLFIAHDLAVVAHACHDVAVMYHGEIVEQGPVDAIYQRPLHPYTKSLLSAIPPDYPGQPRQRIRLQGHTPSPLEPSTASRYRERFPDYAEAFAGDSLIFQEADSNHWVRCSDVDVLRRMQAATATT